ncbi:MAG TPA: Amuc_1100 family pilus-like protein [Verrucomicrobiota bacterium]|nr:Amuc_1100 family pilus-like protein [Verrucomicrobiota bacterium]HNT15037.1 Amuc_1100 family pilus-like protein [Verrucomicrobiota bacterium]
MEWIKRNLIFVVSAVVALILLGAAGWYGYSGFNNNSVKKEAITTAYGELNELYRAKPAPGDGKKVDNIKMAKEQQQEADAFLTNLTAYLQEIPAIPAKTGVTGQRFSAALQETISQLQREATNNSVIVPPGYKFSFSQQASLVQFAPGTLDALAVQLGEVKAICDILNEAKINSLTEVRRERVPGNPDDLKGPVTDYIDKKSITNDLAVGSFYEITFQSFTPELAAVLTGFARSPYGLVVKAINVEPATATLLNELMPTPGMPGYALPPQPYAAPGGPAAPGYQPMVRSEMRMGMGVGGGGAEGRMSRYGGAGQMAPRYAQVPQAQPMPAQPYYANPALVAPKSGTQPFLTEKQLKVTLLVEVLKLLPAKS